MAKNKLICEIIQITLLYLSEQKDRYAILESIIRSGKIKRVDTFTEFCQCSVQTYYNLLNGTGTQLSRPTLFKICIGLELNFDAAVQLFLLAGYIPISSDAWAKQVVNGLALFHDSSFLSASIEEQYSRLNKATGYHLCFSGSD